MLDMFYRHSKRFGLVPFRIHFLFPASMVDENGYQWSFVLVAFMKKLASFTRLCSRMLLPAYLLHATAKANGTIPSIATIILSTSRLHGKKEKKIQWGFKEASNLKMKDEKNFLDSHLHSICLSRVYGLSGLFDLLEDGVVGERWVGDDCGGLVVQIDRVGLYACYFLLKKELRWCVSLLSLLSEVFLFLLQLWLHDREVSGGFAYRQVSWGRDPRRQSTRRMSWWCWTCICAVARPFLIYFRGREEYFLWRENSATLGEYMVFLMFGGIWRGCGRRSCRWERLPIIQVMGRERESLGSYSII